MKRGTPEHPKTIRLATALSVPVAHAVGLLECLWHWAGKYARRGDIGRWPDESIASGAKWEGEAGRFINAMVSTGWIDRDEGCRLIVHDWCDHADNTVRTALKRANEDFFPPTPPQEETKALTIALTAQVRGSGQQCPNSVATPSQQDIEAIYAEYPRKVGKGAALKAIALACKKHDPEWLIERVRTYAASPAGQAGQFTPHPSTWFNQERFNDDEAEWQRERTNPSRNGHPGQAGGTGSDARRADKAQRMYAAPDDLPIMRIGDTADRAKAPVANPPMEP